MLPFLTIDTFVELFYSTVLHPFPPLLTLLSVVSLGHKTESTAFKFSALYFAVTASIYLYQSLDTRLAAGRTRTIDWENEVVVITGGAGGLGSLIAETYGMRGVPVAVLDVKYLNGQEEEELEEKGVRYYRCDVGDKRQVEAVAREITHDLGPPTILINNAAIVNGKPFLDLTEDEIERTYRVNVLAHHHAIRTFLPHMLRQPQGGTIVTVSSVLGQLGCAGLSAYTSTKAAVRALHQSLGAELDILARQQQQQARSSRTAPATSAHASSQQQQQQQQQTYPQSISTILLTPGQLSTALFAAVDARSPFLAPPLPAAYVARRAVRAIDAGRSGELALPLYARWVGALGVLPAGMAAAARAWSGVDQAGWRAVGGGEALRKAE